MISEKTIVGGLLPLFAALLIASPSAAAETGPNFKQLDPDVRSAVEKTLTVQVLKTLGYGSVSEATRTLSVGVTRTDCPSACAGDVGRGLCLCKPAPQSGCAEGTSPVTQGGANWCATLPDTATLFASDGGLGTTRVRVSLR